MDSKQCKAFHIPLYWYLILQVNNSLLFQKQAKNAIIAARDSLAGEQEPLEEYEEEL